MGWMGKTGSREKCDAMVAAAVYVSPRRANVEGGGGRIISGDGDG